MKHGALALALALHPVNALAQDPAQESARRALIVEAEAASDRGEHARALELATRAGALRMTPSLRLLIAQEREALGDILEALDGGERCAREAEVETAMRQREVVLEECRAVVTRARAATATLVVTTAQDDVEVTLDDAPLAPALRGVPLPQRPGSRHVRARHAGEVFFERDVPLRAGDRVAVEVPAPPPPPPPPPPPSTPVPAPTPPPPRLIEFTPRPSRSAGPWVLVGTGVAGMTAGALLWWRRDVAVGDCAIAGDALLCPTAESVTRAESAAALGVLSQVSASMGAAALVAGVVWRLAEGTGAARARAQVWPCADGRRVGLCGAF
ncbi:MAG: hypothetical protein U0325_32640 [Polyangiales bacterium]